MLHLLSNDSQFLSDLWYYLLSVRRVGWHQTPVLIRPAASRLEQSSEGGRQAQYCIQTATQPVQNVRRSVSKRKLFHAILYICMDSYNRHVINYVKSH